MPLGFDYDQNVINAGDSAEIYAYLFDERDRLIPQSDLTAVDFTIQAPDGTTVVEPGTVVDDSKGFLRFLDTDQIGEYKVAARFTLASGAIRSSRADFEVIDPFNPPEPDEIDLIGEQVWKRLEDAFDSEEGGPWLQDVTQATFKKQKMVEFVDQGLFDINNQTPPTHEVIGRFVTGGVLQPDSPLLVQATLLAVIRHLMRSYTEQPTPTGGQIVYEDRKDYLQRWAQIYQIEEPYYMRMLLLWKRQFLGLGSSRILVGSKAGRLTPAPLRTRNVGRGFN
jgi:hypothetical protein